MMNSFSFLYQAFILNVKFVINTGGDKYSTVF